MTSHRRTLQGGIAALLALVPTSAWALLASSTPAPAEGGHDEAHGGGIEWVTPIVGHDGKTGLLWILINFAALMWILERLLFRKLRERQREKHDAIKAELESATAARNEAESLIAEYRERLDRLDEEIAELMEDAKRRAEAERQKVVEAAEQEARRIKEAAAAAAEREAEARRRAIENEIVDRAVARAEALLRDRLTPTHQRQLVDDYIGRLSAVELRSPSTTAVGGPT